MEHDPEDFALTREDMHYIEQDNRAAERLLRRRVVCNEIDYEWLRQHLLESKQCVGGEWESDWYDEPGGDYLVIEGDGLGYDTYGPVSAALMCSDDEWKAIVKAWRKHKSRPGYDHGAHIKMCGLGSRYTEWSDADTMVARDHLGRKVADVEVKKNKTGGGRLHCPGCEKFKPTLFVLYKKVRCSTCCRREDWPLRHAQCLGKVSRIPWER